MLQDIQLMYKIQLITFYILRQLKIKLKIMAVAFKYEKIRIWQNIWKATMSKKGQNIAQEIHQINIHRWQLSMHNTLKWWL